MGLSSAAHVFLLLSPRQASSLLIHWPTLCPPSKVKGTCSPRKASLPVLKVPAVLAGQGLGGGGDPLGVYSLLRCLLGPDVLRCQLLLHTSSPRRNHKPLEQLSFSTHAGARPSPAHAQACTPCFGGLMRVAQASYRAALSPLPQCGARRGMASMFPLGSSASLPVVESGMHSAQLPRSAPPPRGVPRAWQEALPSLIVWGFTAVAKNLVLALPPSDSTSLLEVHLLLAYFGC